MAASGERAHGGDEAFVAALTADAEPRQNVLFIQATVRREAALRFIGGTRGFGDAAANCEVKLLDLAANPYLGVAAVLALSQPGVQTAAQCDPPVAIDPASVPQEQRAPLGIRE